MSFPGPNKIIPGLDLCHFRVSQCRIRAASLGLELHVSGARRCLARGSQEHGGQRRALVVGDGVCVGGERQQRAVVASALAASGGSEWRRWRLREQWTGGGRRHRRRTTARTAGQRGHGEAGRGERVYRHGTSSQLARPPPAAADATTRHTRWPPQLRTCKPCHVGQVQLARASEPRRVFASLLNAYSCPRALVMGHSTRPGSPLLAERLPGL